MTQSSSISREEKLRHLVEMKGSKAVTALTAYDYAVARIIDEAGIDIILVGDSLGMMVFGHEDTTKVTVSMMKHHVAAFRNGEVRSLLVADMPYRSYHDNRTAIETATELVSAGADAVKLEGGIAVLSQIHAILDAGIAVFGHIGMLPQQVVEEGGYKKKGKSDIEAKDLLSDAADLDKAGVTAIILENIVGNLAKEITELTMVPTIGIGSGKSCDGQILVINDLLGSYPWFCPSFAKPKANFAYDTTQAVREFIEEIENLNRE